MTTVKKQSVKSLIVCGGRIIIPDKKTVNNPDIYIANGVIEKIGKTNLNNIPVINLAKEKYISPGFIDMHCHLREPGYTNSETIESGTLSAIAGGFTTICCMPNTTPPLDNPKIINYVQNQAKKANNAEVFVIGCATKNRDGKEIANIRSMVSAGIVAVSDDGSPISNSLIMRKILMYCKEFNIPAINHCEDLELTNKQKRIPDISETIMVIRDILLADLTKSKLHLAHISTKKSVDFMRWAKKQGFSFTAETCPHYFTLTESRLNTNYKVSPPLRTQADVEAIKEGLADGTIDVIATDHAPWDISKKKVKWEKAKSGMIGFETAFSLGYEELVLKKYLSLEKYIACLTTKPAEILKLKERGKIEVGKPANITIINLDKTWTLKVENIVSKSKNSPFIGRKLKGKVEKVIIKDKIFTNS